MDAAARETGVANADGEVVWSCRLGAGVKWTEATPSMTVARKPITGEITS